MNATRADTLLHMTCFLRSVTAALLICSATTTLADAPEIVSVSAERSGMGWRIDVTIRHNDTGWDHYADGWEILDANGKRLGLRKLMHPHVDEQPFTRSLRSVMVPDGTEVIYIRARCSTDGWHGDQVAVPLSH